ncbi:MAG: type IV toxin-antitoxin system AbiEi family antitoxin domain-containing protein [Motilibacteraceae bacterium]
MASRLYLDGPTYPVPAVPALRQVADRQHGAVTGRQVLEAGLDRRRLGRLVATGAWQRVHRDVYVVHSGPLARATALWAAVLACGPGAALARASAAEVWGLDDEADESIHVVLPVGRRITAPSGVIVHYALHLERTRHPTALPPRTTVEDTVLDLVDVIRGRDQVVGLVTRACQRRLTSAARLQAAADLRKKLRWREFLQDLLYDVAEGAESPLEVHYLRDVERAHGLPRGARQDRKGSRFRDVAYRAYLLLVELDGRAAHPDELAGRDQARDNEHLAAGGEATLRYGWAAVVHAPCQVAAQVARALQQRGWTGRAHPCGPGCALSLP